MRGLNASQPLDQLAPLLKELADLSLAIRQDYQEDPKRFRITLIRTLSNLGLMHRYFNDLAHAVLFGEEAYSLCEDILRDTTKSVEECELIASTFTTLMRSYDQNNTQQPEKFDALLMERLPMTRVSAVRALIALGEAYYNFDKPGAARPTLKALKRKREIEQLGFCAAEVRGFVEPSLITLFNLLQCNDILLCEFPEELSHSESQCLGREIIAYLPVLRKKIETFHTYSERVQTFISDTAKRFCESLEQSYVASLNT